MLAGMGYVYDELSDEAKAIYDKTQKDWAGRISLTPEAAFDSLV